MVAIVVVVVTVFIVRVIFVTVFVVILFMQSVHSCQYPVLTWLGKSDPMLAIVVVGNSS